MEVEHCQSPATLPTHRPLEHSIAEMRKKRTRKNTLDMDGLTHFEENDCFTITTSGHGKKSRKYEYAHSPTTDRGRVRCRSRSSTGISGPHNTPVKRTPSLTRGMEDFDILMEDFDEKLVEPELVKEETTPSSSTSTTTFLPSLPDINVPPYTDLSMEKTVEYSSELIFFGPISETISKLADCFVLQRLRHEVRQNAADTSNEFSHREGGGGDDSGLIFGLMNIGEIGNLTSFAFFQPNLKLEEAFLGLDNQDGEKGRLVFIHNRDHGTLFRIEVQVGTAVLLSNSLLLLKPPVGFCFQYENILILANQSMIRTLYNYHMAKEFGSPFLNLSHKAKDATRHQLHTPQVTTRNVGEVFQKHLKDSETFAIYTDVSVGACILYLSKMFPSTLFNMKSLRNDFDQTTLLDFHASTHLRKLLQYKKLHCLNLDIKGLELSNLWHTELKHSKGFDKISSLVERFTREDVATVTNELIPVHDGRDYITLDDIMNSILFPTMQHRDPHISTIQYQHQDNRHGGYCFFSDGNPLKNQNYYCANPSKTSLVGEMLRAIMVNQPVTTLNQLSYDFQECQGRQKSQCLMGFFRI